MTMGSEETEWLGATGDQGVHATQTPPPSVSRGSSWAGAKAPGCWATGPRRLWGTPRPTCSPRPSSRPRLGAPWPVGGRGAVPRPFVTATATASTSRWASVGIRYGSVPIGLRLIRDPTLICEVSDANSTAPHLCSAPAHDEGGRGLYMVARLAGSRGTRRTAVGKTIRAEQSRPMSRP
jgi:hypothetical protein